MKLNLAQLRVQSMPADPQSIAATLGARLNRALLMVVCVLAIALNVQAAPEPEAVPRRWELTVEVGSLRLASVNVPGVGQRPFLVLTYKVVNNSGQDVLLAPSFELSTGDGTLARSGRDVPQNVTAELTQLAQNPLIQDQIAIIGDILQGEQHAKDGIVIWPMTNLAPESITIYAAGFSGESRTITSPDGKDKFVLRKTLRLEYEAPGDLGGPGGRASLPFELQNKGWILR